MQGLAPPDPYIITEGVGLLPGWQDHNGRSLRSLVINPAIRNLVLISSCSQSNRCDNSGSLFSPTNSSVIDNFNVYDGAAYDCAGPLVGCTYNSTLGPGNIMPQIADLLITNNKFDRVILVPLGVGATSITDWSSGDYANKTTVAMKRLAARGIVPGMTGVTFAIEVGIGETDGPAGMTQATWQSNWATFKANTAAAGFLGRYFVAVESYNAGTTYANITAAQAAVVDSVTVFQSGNLDTLGAGSRQADNLHFSTAGGASAATLIYNAMHASGAPF